MLHNKPTKKKNCNEQTNHSKSAQNSETTEQCWELL